MNNAIPQFWSQVEKTDSCWNWTGSITAKGYGSFCKKLNGQTFWRAHRFSWFLHNGPILGGQFVLHKCDNPACVNPDHLWLGTNRDNMDDKIAKGRHRPGEEHHNAKLTDADVIDILNSDETGAALARKYGVHHSQIYRIRKGERWTHVARDQTGQK